MRTKFFLLFIILPIFCFGEITIGKIIFEGNNFLNNNELSNIIFSQNGDIYDQKIINNDLENIANYYEENNLYYCRFFEPEIFPKPNGKVDILFKIEEQNNLAIRKFKFQNNNYISTRKLQNLIYKPQNDIAEIQNTIQNIANFYLENGFLFASISLDSLVIKNDSLDVFINIDEGDFCQFSEYKFCGNKVTKNETLLKISQLINNKGISPKTLDLVAKNIRKKQYIRDCNIFPINANTLLIQVEEDQMNYISGIFGYEKDNLNGVVNIDFLNINGTDRSLSILWQKQTKINEKLELFYHESGLSSLPVNGDFYLSRKDENGNIETQFESNIYYYNFTEKYGVSFLQNNIYETNKIYQKWGGFLTKNTTDNSQNSTRGYNAFFKYFYGTENSSQSATINLENFFSPKTKWVIFSGFNVKLSKNLDEYEFFRLGGNKNLRGFGEDEFSGSQIGWLNTELRYLFEQNSRFFLFCDYGYAQKNENKIFGKLFGFGIGLRLKTRLGIFKIDYGLNYFNKFKNPLDGIIHFGLETKI